jgi:hypothetical protein
MSPCLRGHEDEGNVGERRWRDNCPARSALARCPRQGTPTRPRRGIHLLGDLTGIPATIDEVFDQLDSELDAERLSACFDPSWATCATSSSTASCNQETTNSGSGSAASPARTFQPHRRAVLPRHPDDAGPPDCSGGPAPRTVAHLEPASEGRGRDVKAMLRRHRRPQLVRRACRPASSPPTRRAAVSRPEWMGMPQCRALTSGAT